MSCFLGCDEQPSSTLSKKKIVTGYRVDVMPESIKMSETNHFRIFCKGPAFYRFNETMPSLHNTISTFHEYPFMEVTNNFQLSSFHFSRVSVN
jgi:hypothetical protein